MREDGLKKRKYSAFQLHLDVAYSACHSTGLICVVPFCGKELRICNSFLLQFIPLAIHTTQSSYNHSVFQVAVSTCSVAEISPKETAFAQDNMNLQVFGDKLVLILFVPLLCFLNEKPVYKY